jgi:hypothetical protein
MSGDRCRLRWRTLGAGVLGLLAAWAAPLHAQVNVAPEVFSGSVLERYLRVLQLSGDATGYPWSIRSLSPGEVERMAPRDSAHPWADRYSLRGDTSAALQLQWIRPSTRLDYNSAFPYGSNDGAVWVGRGLTSSVQAGFGARYGPLSLVVAPVAFRAENAEFELVRSGLAERFVFAESRFAEHIDLPQRFGDEPYVRIDPGQTTLRLDAGGIALGASTANQQWGPGQEHPIILGNNAAGFPHLFLGTARPLNVWVGRVHGRMIAGRLEQSDFSTVQHPDSTRRFASGLVATFTPRGAPGLEVGASRFFHVPWPREGVPGDYLLKPFEELLKKRLADRDTVGNDTKQSADNQLASLFARWLFPESGFEIYGEYGRDDHNWNTRDLILLPDHMSAYMLGFQKLWKRAPREWVVVRGELLNSRFSHIHRVRTQNPFGVHGFTRQGHTHRGQMLGSAAEFGGGGSVLAADYLHSRGRWSVSWSRAQRGDNLRYYDTRTIDPRGLDVIHALGAEALWFQGRWELQAGLTSAYDFNRNFAEDALNWNLSLGARVGL